MQWMNPHLNPHWFQSYFPSHHFLSSSSPIPQLLPPSPLFPDPQSEAFLVDHQNAAQRVLDGVNYVVQSVSEYSTGPTKAVTAWLTDQVAPPYWRPNNQITVSADTLTHTQSDSQSVTHRNCWPPVNMVYNTSGYTLIHCYDTQRYNYMNTNITDK